MLAENVGHRKVSTTEKGPPYIWADVGRPHPETRRKDYTMDEENEYTLTRYYTSSPDSLIERVAPCLRAGKIEVVHYCCDHVAIAPGGDDDTIKGMSRVLAEVIDELYEASLVDSIRAAAE